MQVTGLTGVKPAPPIHTAYTYSGDGLRASEATSGVTQHFAYDQAGAVPAILTDGSTSYLYGPGGLPVEQISTSGTPTYFFHDQLGSTRLLTDGSGAVVATYSYDPYGNTTSATGSLDTAIRYAGAHLDEAAGLYYLLARTYDPATGQFLSRDPLAPITQAPYSYVGNDPLNGVDPVGLCGLWGSDTCWSTTSPKLVETLASLTGPGPGMAAAAMVSGLPCAASGRCAGVALAAALGIGALGTAETALGLAHVALVESLVGELVLVPFDLAAVVANVVLARLAIQACAETRGRAF